ncbi:MAG: hypothetical protein LBF86_02010 [Helicobacteraceae bacterium]|nr:hypothetical protein [Helicobacteraceae bacterium]
MKFDLPSAGEITLQNAYGERFANFAPLAIASGEQTVSLAPNADLPLRSAYALSQASGVILFVVPRGASEIEFEKLARQPSRAGWLIWNGDIKSYEFVASLIERIDAHMRDLKTLRGYEGGFFADFCRAQEDEIEREDLTALDLVFFDLAGGNLPEYPPYTETIT